MDLAQKVKAIVLEEGSLSSHAAIVARALSIPMVVQAKRITRDARIGISASGTSANWFDVRGSLADTCTGSAV